MKKLENVLIELREILPVIKARYKVRSLEVFGSYVRNEQRRGSDIDILLELDETIDLFTYVELEDFISEMLGIKVELIMKDTLKPRIKDGILKEAVPV
jgi:predicted nucleotidyltransferase